MTRLLNEKMQFWGYRRQDPADVIEELEALAKKAESEGVADVAVDLRDTMAYILQCMSCVG